MRPNFNFRMDQLSSKMRAAFFFLMLAGATIYMSCKEEQITLPADYAISTRGEGGGGLSTEDLIDLLGNSCIPDAVGENCDNGLITTIVSIQLPDYPLCTFNVQFKYYKCTSFEIFSLAGFELLSYSCPAFTTAINNAYTAGEAALNAFIGNFDYDVAKQFQQYIMSIQGSGKFACDEESYLLIYTYTRVSCFKNCIINYPNGSASQQKVACGSGCCEEWIRVCRDENGWQIDGRDSSDSGLCDGPLLYDSNSLPLPCYRETDCTLTCPEEE